MSSPLLLIRADGGETIGLGHAMRCLALAEAWSDRGGRVAWAYRQLPPQLIDRLCVEGITLIAPTDPPKTSDNPDSLISHASALNASLIAIDGYGVTSDYLAKINNNRPVLYLDDMRHLPSYPVRFLLNQNLSANATAYEELVLPCTTLMLGPAFSLLRREFRNAKKPQVNRQSPALHRVLVTMGGSDDENCTVRILRQLAKTCSREVVAVVLTGPSYRWLAELHATFAELPMIIEHHHAVANVASVIASVDAAISAGGSTVWELLAMSVPAVIVCVSPDQMLGQQSLNSVRLFRPLPISDASTADLGGILDALWQTPRDQHAHRFDASGAVRTVDILREALRACGKRCNITAGTCS